MNIHHYQDLNPLAQRSVSIEIAWQSQLPASEIVPVSVEDVAATELAVVATEGTQVAGFVRAKNETFVADDGLKYRQIGSLFVAEAFRGQDLAHELVSTITSFVVWEGFTPFAFANEKGRGAFIKSGYRSAEPGEVAFASSRLGNEPFVYPRQTKA